MYAKDNVAKLVNEPMVEGIVPIYSQRTLYFNKTVMLIDTNKSVSAEINIAYAGHTANVRWNGTYKYTSITNL